LIATTEKVWEKLVGPSALAALPLQVAAVNLAVGKE
jgi:hypothetical protein